MDTSPLQFQPLFVSLSYPYLIFFFHSLPSISIIPLHEAFILLLLFLCSSDLLMLLIELIPLFIVPLSILTCIIFAHPFLYFCVEFPRIVVTFQAFTILSRFFILLIIYSFHELNVISLTLLALIIIAFIDFFIIFPVLTSHIVSFVQSLFIVFFTQLLSFFALFLSYQIMILN